VTTHLTHDDDPLAGEEEPELVLIDDEEFEAAHRHHRDEDSFGEDDDDELVGDDELEFSFEEDLDEAIALDVSDEMDPTVEEADERMAPLFLSQRDPSTELVDADDDADDVAAPGPAAAAAVAVPALSRQETKAEERRRRQALKRRKEMDKAALLDEQERQREEKAQAAAADREAVAAQKEAAGAEKRGAAEAEKQEAEDKKRAAEEDKQRAAEDKKRAAEDKKRADVEAKARQAEERVQEKRARAGRKAEEKRSRAEAKRRATRPSDDPIPAGLTRFVVDEQPETVATATRKDTTAQKREGTKRSLLVMVIVLLLVVVGVAVYATTRSGSKAGPGRGASAGIGASAHASALPAALASAVSANTVDVDYGLEIGGAHPTSINGAGSVDLATQGSNLSVTYSTGGKSFPEQIVYDGPQAFFNLGVIVNYITPGYDWVSMDLASGGSGQPGIGVGGVLADPSALVSLLQASASSARQVGSVRVDGAPATEYSISLEQAAVTRLLASAGLPAFVRTASYSQLDLQAYVDGSGRVSRIAATATYPDSGQTVTASTTLDLSHYGTPVSVAPPPPPQVVPEQQFEASAARLTPAPTS
jgi:hypothetical protein